MIINNCIWSKFVLTTLRQLHTILSFTTSPLNAIDQSTCNGQQVPIVKQVLFTFRKQLRSPLFLIVFMVVFCEAFCKHVYNFIFIFFPLSFLCFFDLWGLPLVIFSLWFASQMTEGTQHFHFNLLVFNLLINTYFLTFFSDFCVTCIT